MKFRLGSVVVVVGVALVFAPWLIISNPSPWWFVVSVVGLLIAAAAGMGAQMEQLGQGNTGEELLRSLWLWLKKKSRGKRNSG